MSELERRLRASVHAASTAASGARAPRDVKRAITRRRALTLGSAGVAAAVIIGSVTVGGLGLTDTAEPPSVTPAPRPSLDQGTRDYATVPLPSTSHVYREMMPLGFALCGEPAPAPSDSSGDFAATFELPEQLELDRGTNINDHTADRASMTLEYNASDQLPALAGGLTALFIEEGIVVGFSNSPQLPVVATFTPDQTKTYLWRWEGWVNDCDENGRSPYLPGGDYDVVWVSRLHNDLATAAQWSLQQENYSLPAAQDLEAFREGSFYCQQWHTMGTHEPITCSPNALVGFEVDPDANTATVPYDTSYYVRDVDAMFASTPISATLTGDLPVVNPNRDVSVYEPGDEIMCGDSLDDVSGSEAQLSGTLPTDSRLPTPGDIVSAELWRWTLGWSEAHVTVPAQSRIWLAKNRLIEETIEEGDVSTIHTTHYSNEVVGWLDVESVAASSVEIHIYDGPAEWPLTITDAQWCDGSDPSAPHSALADFGVIGFTADPITVTLDDGTHYEDVIIALGTHHFF